MKRNEFILRLAVENKFAFVSEEVDVIQIPDNLYPYERPESSSTLLSISPPLQSPEQDPSLKNTNEKCIVTDVIEEPVMKPSYEYCSETSTQCKKTYFTRPSIELVVPQNNGNHPRASSTTTEQNLPFTSSEKLCLSESNYPDLKIRETSLAEPLIENCSTSCHNKLVNIISDIILIPATSEETTYAQYTSDLTSTKPEEYDIHNFNDEECDQMDIETEKDSFGSIVADNSKNITLLAPLTSQQEFTEESPHFETSTENTDGFNIWPVYEDTENRQITLLENELIMKSSTSPLELDYIFLSDADDEYDSSGDEYVQPTDDDDDDRSSSDSGSEISVENIHRTYSRNTQENITITNMDEKEQTENKNVVELGQEKIPKLTIIHKAFTAQSATSSVTNQQYIKKESARERPTICSICYRDVITHFTRHLLRHHKDNKDVKLIKSLKPGNKERLKLIAALRKQGYFHLNMEKNILNPIKTSKNPETKYFVCTYCLGHYNKKLLYRHVKQCNNKPADVINPGRNCLTNSQMFMASVSSKNHEYLKKSRIKQEVFQTMRADDIKAR